MTQNHSNPAVNAIVPNRLHRYTQCDWAVS